MKWFVFFQGMSVIPLCCAWMALGAWLAWRINLLPDLVLDTHAVFMTGLICGGAALIALTAFGLAMFGDLLITTK